MPRAWPYADCTICAHKLGKASSPGRSPSCQEVWRCFADTPPESVNDKNRSPAHAARTRPSLLSSQVGRDRRTQSSPAAPVPKFLQLHANSAARGIAPCATPQENESCKRANAHLHSPSSSHPEQLERARRPAPACRCNRSFREGIV